MIKWIYLQLILLSSRWARGIKTSQREYGIKPLEPKRRIKHPQPSVIGYTSNMALRSFKCCHQGNKHALSGRHTHTHFSLWSFLTQMARCDNSIKQNQKKKKSHLTVSDFQSPACVSWNLLLTTYSPRQSSARAHTSNSHSSPLSGVSFTSPRSARERDENLG